MYPVIFLEFPYFLFLVSTRLFEPKNKKYGNSSYIYIVGSLRIISGFKNPITNSAYERCYFCLNKITIFTDNIKKIYKGDNYYVINW